MREKEDWCKQNFEQLKSSFSKTVRDVLGEKRDTAFSDFSEQGFPSKKLESWKYTDISPIASTAFKLSGLGVEAEQSLSVSDIETFVLNDICSSRLTFVDGVFSEQLSTRESLPKGL